MMRYHCAFTPGTALPTHDTEMAVVALRAARAEGLAVLERCTIASVERRGKAGVRVTLETPTGNEDIDGSTLLDNTMVYCSSEVEDGNAHNHFNLPVILLGRGGGAITPGSRSVKIRRVQPTWSQNSLRTRSHSLTV